MVITPTENSKDITNSDTFILITFGFPERFDDGGPDLNIDAHEGIGLALLNTEENGFTGIYSIITVESEFSAGKFTQKLRGVIDAITREQDVIHFITRDIN